MLGKFAHDLQCRPLCGSEDEEDVVQLGYLDVAGQTNGSSTEISHRYLLRMGSQQRQ